MSSIIGIATYSFIRMEGAVPLAGEILTRMLRKGVAGVAYVSISWHGEPGQVVCQSGWANAAAAASAKIGHKGLQGQVVSVVDDWGITWTNLVCVDARNVMEEPLVTGVGTLSGKTVKLTTVFTFDPAALFY